MAIDYKKSAFNVIYENKNGNLIIYNSLTGGITDIEKSKIPEISAILNGNTTDNTDYVDTLLKQGHLVKKEFDEISFLIEKRKNALKDNTAIDIIILTTLICNFRCKYCYEQRRDDSLNNEIVNNIKKYLEKVFSENKIVRLFWYGGEPLCNSEPIFDITKYAREKSKEHNVKLHVNITTNGYLIDKYIGQLNDVGIDSYQITVDGDEPHHNYNRPLADGSETYRKIINNIKLILSESSSEIILRTNFNENNLNSLKNVLEEFDTKHRNRLTISLEPIFGDSVEKCTMKPSVITSSLFNAYELSNGMGYKNRACDIFYTKLSKFYYCYAERKAQIAISPKGDVFKCTGSDFSEKNRSGILNTDGTISFNDKYFEWNNHCENLPNICLNCEFFPICMGGCKLNYYILCEKKENDCKIAKLYKERIRVILKEKGYL